MEDVNLHLTGDFHAVSAAHNLCAAFVDNHLYHGNALGIDPSAVTWRRVVDISDRVLRDIVVGLGGRTERHPARDRLRHHVRERAHGDPRARRRTSQDLRRRIGHVVVGTTRDGRPVTAEDLKVAGSMTVLMRDAIKPNLLQNLEGGPVLVHAGPFANIAHGNSSIVADRLGLKLADYVVTESGFGADMGCEKFVNIKCRASGLRPDCAVLVATVRALKAHSGRFSIRPGYPLDPALHGRGPRRARGRACPTSSSRSRTCARSASRSSSRSTRFPTDTPAEHALIREAALEAGAFAAVTHSMHDARRHGRRGAGRGGGRSVRAAHGACSSPTRTHDSVEEKIEKIATQLYGADGVEFSPAARRAIAPVQRDGLRPAAGVHGQDAPLAHPRSRQSRARRPAGRCPCATSGSRRARASSTRCAATS